MKLRQKKALKAASVLLAFSFAQLYVNAALPAPAGGGMPQQPLTAKLITKNNQPITVNGNAMGTGGTILTGATIETGDQMSAMIDLGDAGVVEVGPNSIIKLDFDINGNIRVKVIRGCASAKKKTNVLPGEAELYTDSDSLKTNKKRRNVGGCLLPNGQLGPFGGGISSAAAGGIAASIGGGLLIYGLTRGGTTSNISPSTQF